MHLGEFQSDTHLDVWLLDQDPTSHVCFFSTSIFIRVFRDLARGELTRAQIKMRHPKKVFTTGKILLVGTSNIYFYFLQLEIAIYKGM